MPSPRVIRKKKKDLIVADRFEELVTYNFFFGQVDLLQFPVFQSHMTPANFLGKLKTISNICRQCFGLGETTAGVSLYVLVRDLCLSGCSPRVDVSSCFFKELIDATPALQLQGSVHSSSIETDQAFRALKEHIDQILNICPGKVCVFFHRPGSLVPEQP